MNTNMTPRMVNALKHAAQHPDGMILTDQKTNKALIRRGYAERCYITDAGREAITKEGV